MERIWAPWRMAYISEAVKEEKPKGCIFCDFPAAADDEKHLILARSEYSFVIMNKYPYNNGHLMVIPFEHVNSPAKLSAAAQDDLHRLLYRTLDVLNDFFHPEGFNIGMNLGQVAGAGIAAHCHYHIVPRWNGDTNFMPVLGDVRVISESLEATYAHLKPLFDKLAK